MLNILIKKLVEVLSVLTFGLISVGSNADVIYNVAQNNTNENHQGIAVGEPNPSAPDQVKDANAGVDQVNGNPAVAPDTATGSTIKVDPATGNPIPVDTTKPDVSPIAPDVVAGSTKGSTGGTGTSPAPGKVDGSYEGDDAYEDDDTEEHESDENDGDYEDDEDDKDEVDLENQTITLQTREQEREESESEHSEEQEESEEIDD